MSEPKRPGILKRERKRREKAKLLCVDDEPFILDGLSVNLRKHYAVTTALGGKEGLEKLQSEGPFPIVISDMRMPEMDGATFLKQVRQLAPDSTRLLLTGHADLEAAVKAVNEAKIYRYVTKPCPVKELVDILDDALKHYHRIQAQRDVLKRTLHASVQTMNEVLSLVNPGAFSRGARVQRLVRSMADYLELPDPWEYEIAGMLSQVGTVTLPADTLDKLLSGYDLEDHEAELFDNHPSVTEHLLQRIPKLEEVAEMVGGQMNAFEAEVMGHDIRLEPRSTTGAHLLSVAVDFDLAVSRGLEPKEALADLSERAEDYDPRILDALAAIEIIPPKQVSRMAKLDDLATGMIIEEDIESQEGVVLISKGQEVNFTTIERLRRFKDDRGLIEPFKVTVRI